MTEAIVAVTPTETIKYVSYSFSRTSSVPLVPPPPCPYVTTATNLGRVRAERSSLMTRNGPSGGTEASSMARRPS